MTHLTSNMKQQFKSLRPVENVVHCCVHSTWPGAVTLLTAYQFSEIIVLTWTLHIALSFPSLSLFLNICFVSLSLPSPLYLPPLFLFCVLLCHAGCHFNRSAPWDDLLCDCCCVHYQGWWCSQQGQGGHHHRSRCVLSILTCVASTC